jgi:hypothetical protein
MDQIEVRERIESAGEELQSLLQRRQSLALDVLNQLPGANEALDHVERRLTVVMRHHELAALATSETGRREADARLVERYAQLMAQRQQCYKEIDAAMAAVVDPVRRCLDIDTEARQVSLTLGISHDRRNHARLADFFNWQLAEAGLRPDFAVAFKHMWHPLTEAVA